MSTNPFDDPQLVTPEPASPTVARLAFSLAAIAIGFQTADLALHLYTMFTADEQLFGFMRRPEYGWYVGTPITWGAALASYMLLADSVGSPRRVPALILAAMNTFDLFLWLSEHAVELNVSLPLDFLRDPWLRQASSILQWFELVLFTGLASSAIRRMGGEEPRNGIRRVRATALLGLMVWALNFALRSSIYFGWVRRVNRRVWAEILLLDLFNIALLAVTAFQVTVLCTLTARYLARELRVLRKAEDDYDLLLPQPDPYADEERRRRKDDPFGPLP